MKISGKGGNWSDFDPLTFKSGVALYFSQRSQYVTIVSMTMLQCTVLQLSNDDPVNLKMFPSL